jgi:imidazolonepropionase
MIAAGLPLALATDYNPGSTPSGNMNFVVATACIKMKMTPEEAINAATINGAYAMGISNTHGSNEKKQIYYHQTNSFLLSIAICFCSNLIDSVFLEGNYYIKKRSY